MIIGQLPPLLHSWPRNLWMLPKQSIEWSDSDQIKRSLFQWSWSDLRHYLSKQSLVDVWILFIVFWISQIGSHFYFIDIQNFFKNHCQVCLLLLQNFVKNYLDFQSHCIGKRFLNGWSKTDLKILHQITFWKCDPNWSKIRIYDILSWDIISLFSIAVGFFKCNWHKILLIILFFLS